jgi:hypothetical protein
MELLLYIIAVLLFIGGVWYLIQRNFLMGIVLILLAFLIGPGGVSLLL